jgi:hypothetical protein
MLEQSDETKLKFARAPDGSIYKGWKFEDNQFCYTCVSSIAEYLLSQNEEGTFDDMTWDLFDQMAGMGGECYALDHKGHLGRPMSKAESREHIKKIFLASQQSGGRIISSENFNDTYVKEYDMASILALPFYGPWEFWPVPLTGLVYHDCMVHTWHEGQPYDNLYYGYVDGNRYQISGGYPRLQSVMDALYGGMPMVFAFGAQYEFADHETKETFAYQKRLEHSDVRFALELAKPVCDLHREIGMLEMTGFEFLSDDGWVQKTTFANGTEVYANFACGNSVVRNGRLLNSHYIEGLGVLQPKSWGVVRR